jgi:hypothetical protein
VRALLPALLLALAACSAPEAPAPAAAPTPVLDGSWVDQIVERPERFDALASGPGRAGWIALHSNDLHGAVQGFTDDDADSTLGRGRALWELAQLYHAFAAAGDLAWERSFATWSEKSTIPTGSALGYVAGLAALEQGDREVADAWFRLCAAARDPSVVRAAELVAAAEPGVAIEGDDLPPLVQRYNQHLAVRASGEVGSLAMIFDQPLITEIEERPDGSQLSRAFYDPQLLRTLAIAYGVQAGRVLGSEDPLSALGQAPVDALSATLFGPVTSGGALEAEASRAAEAPRTLGASSAALAALGLDSELPATDEADWARAQVRRLDSALDAWAASAREGASDDALALLDQLQVVRIFRSRVLLALGRKALLVEHPWQALAFAQLALDLESSRAINHVNHPGLRAIIIEAQLRTGHTREALDAIQPLLGDYPALTGLDEVLGDLAILQGLDRYGDSKEN